MQVDDKYQFSFDNKDNRVHGWISSNPHVGFWVILPSDESRAGGPLKQELSSHTGPTTLVVSRTYLIHNKMISSHMQYFLKVARHS